jgi:hypothetical protein
MIQVLSTPPLDSLVASKPASFRFPLDRIAFFVLHLDRV